MTRRSRRGSAIIEFSLWFPILMLMFAGIVDLSMYMTRAHTIVRAARDGARVASALTPSGVRDATNMNQVERYIESRAIEHAMNVMRDSGLPCGTGCSVTAVWSTDRRSPDDYEILTVSVSTPYRSVLGLTPYLDRDGLRAQFTMLTQVQTDEVRAP